MGAFRTYLRRHPWQRRVFTFLLAVLLGLSVGCFAWPMLRDRDILRMLDSPDAGVRQRGVRRAVVLAWHAPAFVRKIDRRLDGMSDRQFGSAAEVLSHLGLFNVPGRDGRQLDRLRMVQLASLISLARRQAESQPAAAAASQPGQAGGFPASAPDPVRSLTSQPATASGPASPSATTRPAINWSGLLAGRPAGRLDELAYTRMLILNGLILDQRDNEYVRRALGLVVDDPDRQVRGSSAILAAQLKDAHALERLMQDESAEVRAIAALDAGLGGAPAGAALLECLRQGRSEQEIAAAAGALVRLANEPGPLLTAEQRTQAQRLTLAALAEARRRGSQEQIDRLLYVVSRMPFDQAAPVVGEVLAAAQAAKENPPVMALVAAGHLGMRDVQPDVERLIAEIQARKEQTTIGEMRLLGAVFHAAGLMRLPLEQAIAEAMNELWHEGTALAMLLGAEAIDAILPPRPDAWVAVEPDRAKLETTLDRAARAPDAPLASAAAAATLFRMVPTAGGSGTGLRGVSSEGAIAAVMAACEGEWTSGDYVAWRLRDESSAKALAAALAGKGVYSEHARSLGVLLQALLARGKPQAEQTAEALRRRIEGRGFKDLDPSAAATYKCGLLILGDRRYLPELEAMLYSELEARNRVLMALIVARQPAGFDSLLGRLTFDGPMLEYYLAGQLVARYYAAAMPDLPRLDLEAPYRLRLWQCRMIRDYYLIHRREVVVRQSN